MNIPRALGRRLVALPLCLLSVPMFAFATAAAELPNPAEPPSTRNPAIVIHEIELNVLIRHYEKMLTLLYDTQLEESLLSAVDDDKSVGPGAKTADVSRAAMQRKLKVVQEEVYNVRNHIAEKAEVLNKLEESQRAQRQVDIEKRLKKLRENPPSQPAPVRPTAPEPPPARF